MPIDAQLIAPTGFLSHDSICETIDAGLSGKFTGQKLLVLIPDHTRSLPLPFLFHTLVEVLKDAQKITFMVALGTHPALSEDKLNQLVGISAEERRIQFKNIVLLNHAWQDATQLTTLGLMHQDEIKAIAGNKWHESLPNEVAIRINKAVMEHDHTLILGPTFPHEVVGFSGGAKYLFPGISGAEMINATHWLGALSGVVGTIGIKETPVRTMINSAAQRLKRPVTLISLIVHGEEISGVFIGDLFDAWNRSADLSSQQHVLWNEKPFHRVLSCAPAMYDELWTAAKAMYKIEPVVALGGEVVVFAPHLNEISQVHGKYIYEIGYHTLPYFLANWDRFKHYPLGVLAHSTHFRGSGVMEGGIEKPNVRVSLASRISAEDCSRLNLGYVDPASIDPNDWKDHESEGTLYVPKAGEMLYRVALSASGAEK